MENNTSVENVLTIEQFCLKYHCDCPSKAYLLAGTHCYECNTLSREAQDAES
jgi:hypothetical protein